MLRKFELNDKVLNRGEFIADEVPYNLVHRICGSAGSTCLKSSDDAMIFAQSEGHNAWLWISKEVADNHMKALIDEIIGSLEGKTLLPGITGEPKTVELFARSYSEARNIQYHTHMTMESYACPEAKKPSNVAGTLHQAAIRDLETVAGFFAGFSEGAYGISVDPASQIRAAKGAIESGNLYLWFVDGSPVSMANIAHRSPRNARINAVYTPPDSRKRGYASAIVAELCAILESERLLPMLYADLKNPDSNKVYQNIGFVECGQIVDLKFSLDGRSERRSERP